MGSATTTSLHQSEMADLSCNPLWLVGDVDVVAAGRSSETEGDDADQPAERNWVLCSSACGLAMIRLGPVSGGSRGRTGPSDGAAGRAGDDDGQATESSSDTDNGDDSGLSIGDMVRIQREIGRLSERTPGKGKSGSKALAS